MMVDIPESDIIDLLNEYGSIVKKIARSAHYSSASISLADLYQVGDIAVLRAIKNYDPTQGTSIKSFVAKMVRQDIFNEAAKFLGVFTVDHRVTSLAAKVNKLHNNDKTDEEIADILSESSHRKFDVEHVKDLRIIYDHRTHNDIQENDIINNGDVEENTIKMFLDEAITSHEDNIILQHRLLGNASVDDISLILNITVGQIYILENDLKDRIRKVIIGAIE